MWAPEDSVICVVAKTVSLAAVTHLQSITLPGVKKALRNKSMNSGRR